MSSRQRGATWLLAVILAGRIVDRLDLPFENRLDDTLLQVAVPADSLRDEVEKLTRRGSEAARPAGPDSVVVHGKLGINTADVRELQRLPRVGPILAARIVAFRQENGPFHSMADLRRVQGIGARTAAQLAPLVRFD